ncbi:hypothetical protein LIER_43148 [Lithospermum erythrorhizon]|uniref:Uncharacterized protein n=1 Tax=Lithospermum erythrorhizon TaxID=34254 RepID=A0AAV3PLP3_LITER
MCGEPNHNKRSCPQNKKQGETTTEQGETSIATTKKKAAHKKGKAATKTKMKGFRRTLHKSVNLWGLGMKVAARTNNLRRSDVEKISTDNNLCNGNFWCSK